MSDVRVGVRHAVDKLFARFPKDKVVEELQRLLKRETAPAPAPEPEAAPPEEPEAEEESEAEPPPETPHKRSTGRKK